MNYLAVTGMMYTALTKQPHHSVVPQMDGLMVLGFLSAFFTLVCYFHQHESEAFVLMLAMALAATAVYGFLQGAWPLGFVEVVWSVSAFRRWRKALNRGAAWLERRQDG